MNPPPRHCEQCGTLLGYVKRGGPKRYSRKRFCGNRCLANATLSSRFWTKVDIGAAGECWEWRGYRTATKLRYGRIQVKGKVTSAHRVAWELTNGQEVPPGQMVCHKCDNPPCCNPNHLFLGDAASNNADMARKGRSRYLRGEDSSQASLTRKDVMFIRRLLRDGHCQRGVAARYGISQQHVSDIHRNRRWTE